MHLVEQDKHDRVALLSGDVGLTINTIPYDVLGAFSIHADHLENVTTCTQLTILPMLRIYAQPTR